MAFLLHQHHRWPLSAVLELAGPRRAPRAPALCEVGFCPLMSRWVPGMPWGEGNSWGFLSLLNALLVCGRKVPCSPASPLSDSVAS